MNNKNAALSLICLFLAGCASPNIVEERQVGDEILSCSEIKEQIEDAKRFEDKARDEKGVTGTNVAAAILFWPALLVTYDNVGDAVDAATERKRHLHSLYTKKNCNAIASGENSATGTLHDKLVELSDLYKQGVLTEEEYGAAKHKVLGL